VWQWVQAGHFSPDDVRKVMAEEIGDEAREARAVFEQVALSDEFVEFLTLAAYDRLP
jgi:hypothetical protein